MKIKLSLLAALTAVALTAGAAAGKGGPGGISICEPDESDGYSSLVTYGQPVLHGFTVTNPCDSWYEFYFGAEDQLNPDVEFLVPPHTTVTVGQDRLHDFGADIKYTFGGGGNNSNVNGPCPAVSPAKAMYLVGVDGKLQPFSCPS